jgi:NAD(P)-dependent dehydrogenase (short-subunit alcohol dehydrogenase family)
MHSTPKVALVTGASSGFDLATVALLAAQGFLYPAPHLHLTNHAARNHTGVKAS